MRGFLRTARIGLYLARRTPVTQPPTRSRLRSLVPVPHLLGEFARDSVRDLLASKDTQPLQPHPRGPLKPTEALILPRQADRSPIPCLGRRQAGPGGRDAHAACMRCRSRLRAGCRVVCRRSGMSSCSNALGASAGTPRSPPQGLGHQRRRLFATRSRWRSWRWRAASVLSVCAGIGASVSALRTSIAVG